MVDEEETIMMPAERRKDKANCSHFHKLSGIVLKKGKYAEAEEKAEMLKVWLDSKLGRDLPRGGLWAAEGLLLRLCGNKVE